MQTMARAAPFSPGKRAGHVMLPVRLIAVDATTLEMSTAMNLAMVAVGEGGGSAAVAVAEQMLLQTRM